MGTAITTAVLTIIGGVTVYVLGQIITKFFIEPYQEYRKTVGEIAYTLVYYANVSAGTGEDRQHEAWSAFRQNAARLLSSTEQIPSYDWFARKTWTNLPPTESVNKAFHALIGLSNAAYGSDWEHIGNHRKAIIDNLKLKGIEP
jgi:hypothetical protein